ncbi:MAG: CDGSH iron-sulfur domain-containing protein [Magnetococcales bacterium]|nr:CDGSH iron-sulfur domain-containing protein [Magnetococcales bacterium]MBF0116565.1 CDGSH iron-sulfur domain-containing protein [Magnetococcales bacterium]
METPLILDLPAGEHHICLCGRSKNAPHCDGSHKGGRTGPRRVMMDHPGRVAVCSCGKTSAPPFCDGSHE